MAKFHFVEDYERYVRHLMRRYPIDEAMSRAVGGDYERLGALECEIVRYLGLGNGTRFVDFGCGSGRLAVQLARVLQIDYLGLDVVGSLLDYARSKCPPEYRFAINEALTLPVETASVDWFAAFSVFTHLLHTESYLYLEEMHRALRPGGRVVASFLEFAVYPHWQVFRDTLQQQRNSHVPHINQFIERNAWELWAREIGFAEIAFVDGLAAPWPSGQNLGQSIVVLRKG